MLAAIQSYFGEGAVLLLVIGVCLLAIRSLRRQHRQKGSACAGGCAGALRRGYSFAPGAPITLAVRSEHVEFTKDPAACGIAAVIREKTFAGGMLRIALELSDGTTLIASRHGIDMDVQTGDAVRVTWAPASAVPVDVEAEEAK